MVEAARKRRNNTSVSQEDYLKAIWEMEQEEQEHISARLSEVLGVTPPAVTAALKRMARKGSVRLLRRGQMRLTSKGREIAKHLILRHRLAEKLLSEVLGMPWTRVHDEAEKLEHAISPEVEGLLLKYFGRQSSCPHGNPLFRGVSGQRRRDRARRLSEMRAGQQLEIQRVYEKESGFLEYLDYLPVLDQLAELMDQAYAANQAGDRARVDALVADYLRLYQENVEYLK